MSTCDDLSDSRSIRRVRKENNVAAQQEEMSFTRKLSPHADYSIGESKDALLGSGAFGAVYRATSVKDQKPVALKKIDVRMRAKGAKATDGGWWRL